MRNFILPAQILVEHELNVQTFKVDPREVGKIIGTRGATIKGLQQELNVRINISRDNCEVRISDV